jgi:hypothetical protein
MRLGHRRATSAMTLYANFASDSFSSFFAWDTPLRSFVYLARVPDMLKCLWRRLSRLGYGVGTNIPTALWEHRTQLEYLRWIELDGKGLHGVWIIGS